MFSRFASGSSRLRTNSIDRPAGTIATNRHSRERKECSHERRYSIRCCYRIRCRGLAIVLMIWSLAGTSGGRQVATTTGTITPRKPRPQRRLLPRRPTTRVLPARDSLKGPTPRSTSRLPPPLSGAEYYWCDGEPLKVRGGRFGTSRSSEVQNRRIVLKKSFFADD
jgi:hypothetical protein